MAGSWIDLPLTITTPMFCGRARGGVPAADGFRVNELRGSLAFWLRAMLGAELTTVELRRLESSVFGAAAEPGKPFVPSVAFRVTDVESASACARVDSLGPGLAYLAGQGVSRREPGRTVFSRKPLQPGVAVTVQFRVPSTSCEGPVQPLLAASLWAMCALGGVGARTRRGFGGVRCGKSSLVELWSGLATPGDGDAFWNPARARQIAAALRAEIGVSEPEGVRTTARPALQVDGWSFSVAPKILGACHEAGSAERALEEIGVFLRRHRTIKRNGGRIKRVTPEYQTHFASWIPSPRAGLDQVDLPSAAFGLPIMFYTSNKHSAQINFEKEAERRPSPVWLRLIEIDGYWRLLTHAFHDQFAGEGVGRATLSRNNVHLPVNVSDDVVRGGVDRFLAAVSAWA